MGYRPPKDTVETQLENTGRQLIYGYARVSAYGQMLDAQLASTGWHAAPLTCSAPSSASWTPRPNSVHSPSRRLTPGTSTGRLMIAVLGGLADVERDLIRTRTAEGRSRDKAQGRHMGRPDGARRALCCRNWPAATTSAAPRFRA
jgi:DNA invertase Pin-like site-specific DNA recombinase